MTEQILQVLAIAPGPQTGTELCDSLRRTGLRAEESQVIESLRRLQRDGFVELERRTNRWRLLRLPPDFQAPHNPPAVIPRPSQSSAQAGNHAVKQQPTPMPIVPPPAPAGRWALFRRLCHYYMDCLLQDEAPQLRAYVDNEDDTWIAAREIPWARLAAGGDFALSLSREQAPFQRNRVRRGEDECVYLCYPLVFVKPKDTSGFIVPLFAQPMQADWRAGVLHLQPDGPIAVNGAWLEFRFRQRVEREAFLRAMGFWADANGDDENGERAAPGPKDFARLAQDAAHYVHDAERFAEHIEPFALSTITDWKKAKPGLYNVPVLMASSHLRHQAPPARRDSCPPGGPRSRGRRPANRASPESGRSWDQSPGIFRRHSP
jgi:hypothetical protein